METEAVRQHLNLGRVHLLGHSWGGWLGIEYALTHPGALKTLILADTNADMPHLVLNRTGAPCVALIAHSAADDQEGIILLPELDRLHLE